MGRPMVAGLWRSRSASSSPLHAGMYMSSRTTKVSLVNLCRYLQRIVVNGDPARPALRRCRRDPAVVFNHPQPVPDRVLFGGVASLSASTQWADFKWLHKIPAGST